MYLMLGDFTLTDFRNNKISLENSTFRSYESNQFSHFISAINHFLIIKEFVGLVNL